MEACIEVGDPLYNLAHYLSIFAHGNNGLQRGEVVTAIEDNRIQNSGDLLGALREHQPGQQVRLTLTSEGEERQVEVRLGERPESAGSG